MIQARRAARTPARYNTRPIVVALLPEVRHCARFVLEPELWQALSCVAKAGPNPTKAMIRRAMARMLRIAIVGLFTAALPFQGVPAAGTGRHWQALLPRSARDETWRTMRWTMRWTMRQGHPSLRRLTAGDKPTRRRYGRQLQIPGAPACGMRLSRLFAE